MVSGPPFAVLTGGAGGAGRAVRRARAAAAVRHVRSDIDRLLCCTPPGFLLVKEASRLPEASFTKVSGLKAQTSSMKPFLQSFAGSPQHWSGLVTGSDWQEMSSFLLS